MLGLFEDVLKGKGDGPLVEETLRRYYNRNGYLMYGFDKLVAAIVKFANQVLGTDTKEKSATIIDLFYKNRKEHETTPQQEIDYRKAVEKLAKDSDVFKFAFVSSMSALQQVTG